jgi:hypothetical protein
LQRAQEFFQEGLKFMRQGTDQPQVRAKFTCKLLEGLGHLYCEPLLFQDCAKLLAEAEAIYKAKESFFTTQDIVKFNIKKASFIKKFGFFYKAIALLEETEKTLLGLLKASADLKTKKLLFKVYRDKARLYALKREEEKA